MTPLTPSIAHDASTSPPAEASARRTASQIAALQRKPVPLSAAHERFPSESISSSENRPDGASASESAPIAHTRLLEYAPAPFTQPVPRSWFALVGLRQGNESTSTSLHPQGDAHAALRHATSRMGPLCRGFPFINSTRQLFGSVWNIRRSRHRSAAAQCPRAAATPALGYRFASRHPQESLPSTHGYLDRSRVARACRAVGPSGKGSGSRWDQLPTVMQTRASDAARANPGPIPHKTTFHRSLRGPPRRTHPVRHRYRS
jgi:hypothetical protein